MLHNTHIFNQLWMDEYVKDFKYVIKNPICCTLRRSDTYCYGEDKQSQRKGRKP